MLRLLIMTLLITSCAGGKLSKTEFNEGDVLEEFKDEHAQSDRFKKLKSHAEDEGKQQELPAPPKTLPEKKQPIVERQKPKDKIVKTKKVKKTAVVKVIKVVKEETSVKKTESLPKPQLYPDGYPEELKRISENTADTWKEFTPNYVIGESLRFDVSYLGITAGHATLTVKGYQDFEGKDVIHFYGKLKSAPYYNMIYALEDYLEAFAFADTLLPVKYLFIQRESKKNSDDIQMFDIDKMMTYLRYRKEKDGQVRKIAQDKFIPQRAVDAFSSIYFVRGLPLEPGKKFQFPMVMRGKTTIVDLEVTGKEKRNTLLGKKDTIVVKAITTSPSENNKVKGKATFWFEDNHEKTFLRFEVELKFGSIVGDISKAIQE